MPRNSMLAKDLLNSLSSAIATIEKQEVKKSKITERGYNKVASTPYDKYLAKLENGDFDKFNTRDLTFFFRDKAEEIGVKYIVADYKIDMRNFKLCLSRGYDVKDILVMVDFLFCSNQDYLAKNRLHPGILLTNWCNTIYTDSQLWLDDLYKPKSASKSKSRLTEREWSEEVKDTKVKIGEW